MPIRSCELRTRRSSLPEAANSTRVCKPSLSTPLCHRSDSPQGGEDTNPCTPQGGTELDVSRAPNVQVLGEGTALQSIPISFPLQSKAPYSINFSFRVSKVLIHTF